MITVDRILVIDDDVELCTLVVEYLAPEGFLVECAHDGKRGLEAAVTGEHLLVVLDVMWPGMSGFDVLRRIRGFFFQAEDGIRDLTVTGVQTCALPIFAIDYGYNGCNGFIPENCDRTVGIRIIPLDRKTMTAQYMPGIVVPMKPFFGSMGRSEEHTSELQSQSNLACRLLLGKKSDTSLV